MCYNKPMLKETAFANAIAVLIGLFYAAFYVLSLIAPGAFEFLFNAQFFGAGVAALIPDRFSFGSFLGVLVATVVLGWIMGYVWAWLYNRFAR